MGKVFAITVQILIILSLILFSVSTVPALHSKFKGYLDVAEFVVIIVFTVEYVLRVFVAENRLKFIFSFYGLIDIMAILPFYLAVGLNLQALRVLRIFVLFRILKLVRYSSAVRRYMIAFRSIKEELVLFCIMSAILLYLSAVGIYYFENQAQPEQFKSVFHSLWWALTTLTTVGYGDMYPVTTGGKFFSFFVLIIGLGVVAVPSGLMASALSGARKE